MLTIGRLAAYVGVTVRAVRHYHQRGLLAEPARDASGYRRYDAQAVVDLIRIKTLSDAGVPLARIADLLNAEPERFSQAVTEIDEALKARIRDLERQRHRIAELVGGERLFLPPEVTAYLDALREAGVSARSVRLERDGWILLAARSPQEVREWAKGKRELLADPEFQRLYVAYDQAHDWDPADPRLEPLADEIVAFAGRQNESEWTTADPVAVTLVASQPGSRTPAWDRLNRLCKERMPSA